MERSIIKKKMAVAGILCFCLWAQAAMGQQMADSLASAPLRKNVIRYNLSGALMFGFDKYIVLGYERVIRPRQSISVNFGKTSLPKVVSISTDSFDLKQQGERSGMNISVDYRFYLAQENKHNPPHGLYIGPYYSYNHFTRDNQWDQKNSTSNNFITTNSKFNIHTIGFEVGYQFVLWERVTLDLVMVGPGVGFYDYKAKFDSNLSQAARDQLIQGLQELLTQKFPGFNYVFAEKEISGTGTLNTTALGYRYLMQIGFNF